MNPKPYLGATLFMIAAAAPAAGQVRLLIGPDTSTWAAASGQLRLRGEHWSGFNAGAPAGADHDDAFALSRLLLRGEVQYRGAAAVVAELKSSAVFSRELPGGRRVSDEDLLDVQQLYAEFRGQSPGLPGSVRAGRFELGLGRERLVSPLDWTNTRRTFQGAAARVTWRRVAWQAFWVEPVAVRRRKPNTADSTRALYGVHLARGPIEGYWLRNESRLTAERRHTFGARVSRRPAAGRLDYDVEAAWQSGTQSGADVSALMAGSQVGTTLRGRLGARLHVGFDYASGDDAGDAGVGTFNQLYPLGHAYLGFIDLHGRQNVVAVSAGAAIRPAANVTVQLDLHDFRRASDSDALYGADGSVARAAGAGLSRRVGTEIDLTVRRSTMGGHLVLQAGASRYFAGAFLEQSGPARDISWMYGQVTAMW